MRTAVLATAVLVLGAVSVSVTTQSRSDAVSGTLTRTFSIVADTEVTGDITCAVADGTPCLSFAASGVELRLNGFTITGKGDPVTGCGGAVTPGEVGITTNGQRTVVVRGPGLIQRFRNHGVQVAGSDGARIEGITVSTNCGSGIFVPATSFNTVVQENTAVRNGSSNPGLSCGGIWVVGHNSRVRLNTAHGNGYSEPPDDFGIGVIGNATGNVIELNLVTGNTNGIYIAAAVGQNIIRNNTAIGNPAIQVGNTRPDLRALDIVNLSPADRTVFDRNKCVTALAAPCPAINP